MKSVMQQDFGRIEAPKNNRSMFNLSHGYKTAFDAGDLIPIMIEEVLPGDTWNVKTNLFGRLATMLYPILDNLHMDTFHFYCPSRILWDNYERFLGSQDVPDASTDYEMPQLAPFDDTSLSFTELSLPDYMGIPTKVEILNDDLPNALPFRMYNKIWNEWFRDENLQAKLPEYTGDGPDFYDHVDPDYGGYPYEVRKRNKRSDYFTRSLPFAQKGDDVALPIGGLAPVYGNGKTLGLMSVSNTTFGLKADGTGVLRAASGDYDTNFGNLPNAGGSNDASHTLGVTTDTTGKSGLVANLALALAPTVNELREAIAMQQVLELDARGGTRYVEGQLATWGVRIPDYRIQRPEYLGGSSQRISVSAVAQTSASPASPTTKNAQANLAAYAHAGDQSGYVKTFVESGYIMTLVNVRADLTYQQGIRRMWSRRTRFDYPHPAFMHLGEQPVYNKEIYYANLGTDANGDSNDVFGYQERYAEMRFIPSQVTGPMRSNYTGTLDSWHLALKFTITPLLDGTFIVDEPPIDRVIAVTTEPQIILDVYHDIKTARPMPTYGTPGLLRF